MFGASKDRIPRIGFRRSQIGYMPQESSLINGFTVYEIIRFYGALFGLKAKAINKRFKFLSELLELPDESMLLSDLSGGQQRRISFALTLIHKPELLILDEPTVGVDPLLRSKIWEYLTEITTTKNVTVLLSTHYIDEARQAACVGIMRNGVLIAEDSPTNILKNSQIQRLQNIYLGLCVKQDNNIVNKNIVENHKKSKKESMIQEIDLNTHKTQQKARLKHTNLNILIALLVKNFVLILRSPA